MVVVSDLPKMRKKAGDFSENRLLFLNYYDF